MNKNLQVAKLISWLFFIILVIIGILNLVLIHPVPGILYFVCSLLYLPPLTEYLKQHMRFGIHPIIKILIGIFLMMFTLGVSDLAEMYHI